MNKCFATKEGRRETERKEGGREEEKRRKERKEREERERKEGREEKKKDRQLYKVMSIWFAHGVGGPTLKKSRY